MRDNKVVRGGGDQMNKTRHIASRTSRGTWQTTRALFRFFVFFSQPFVLFYEFILC